MAAYSYHQAAIPGPTGGSGVQFFGVVGEDTTYTKVFVGGLAWETQSYTLRRYFEHFGDILEAVVIADKNTGRSKGYGFVTFFDPEAARRACIDPSPLIDGRRANCNLASLGRPRASFPYGRLRPANPSIGNMQSPRSAYSGSPGYRQPVSYSYQPGLAYPPYGYTAYGPEYVYPQGVYNPYMGQQYMQMYGIQGPAGTGIYPYGQLRQPIPGGQGYSAHQSFAMPGHHVMQVGRPNINGTTAATFSTLQAPYPIGVAAPNPGQPHIILHAPSQITQDSGSDQTVG